MRTTTIILLLLLVTGAEFANAVNARFYITTSTTNELEQTYMDDFQRNVIELIKENYSCASIQTASNVAAMLGREKERQLLGVGKENAVENIGESMICDYLISLNIRMKNNVATIVAFCANPKIAKVLSRASSVAQDGNVLKTMDKVAQQLTEGLKQYEICPFVGPVSITINSELDSTNKVDYGVYCNESDQQFHQEMVIHNTTYSEWKLQRKHLLNAEGLRVFYAEGTMTFNWSEESKMIEENGCYKCKSGREGGRTYSETSSMKVKGSGISQYSIRNGKPQDDARIDLRFLDDSTYYVIAQGTSNPAPGEEKVVSGAEGTCDNKPQETKIAPREVTIPLKVIFGPYPGKSTDEVLRQTDTKETTDPSTNEKSTITIDFTLTRK
ncbi:MAG: hypothetical protein Q7U54_00635 [Bacteroidales bacterium]|nr:hypothetical protein [Bacteroidales bacterium]